jgi:CPA1 family monovalent cation:H+ antiporter
MGLSRYPAENVMNDTHFTITIFIVLLLIASGVAMVTRWVRVPYTLALVIVGLLISPMHFIPAVHVSPELILLIFLPALLFEAAWNLRLDHLRENLAPILTLAVPGVLVSVGVVGAVLHFGVGWPWPTALLFGAIISATDPVSVLALFKKLGLPKRLNTIVEGESLINDGTAVVVFKIILAIAAGATMETSMGGLALDSLREFIKVVFGGLAAGAVVGMAASALTARFDDHLLEITLTTIAAYGSFLGAEGLHVSPVIAVLTAGLIIGNYGRRAGMSPTTQVAVNSFWEYAAFVVNSLVFLLVGLETQLTAMFAYSRTIAWGVLALLLSRIVTVYGLMPLANRLAAPVPFRWRHVLFWGGLRGSLSIALALSLPLTLERRSELVMMIFGAVVFSLLVQGLTISPMLKWLGLGEKPPGVREYEVLQGHLLADTAALAELDSLRTRGVITMRVYDDLKTTLSETHQNLSERLAQLDKVERVVERQQEDRIRHHLSSVKKARLNELLSEGIITDDVHREVSGLIDRDLAVGASERSGLKSERSDQTK